VADSKISALTETTTLADTDEFVVASSGTSKKITKANLETEIVGSIPTDYVAKATYDANTILKADSDNTPAALTMGASTILARLASGSIVAATPTEIKTLLGGFMTITEYASGTETVSTSEWSLTTDTAGPDTQTDDGEYQFFFDVSALAKGDVFQFAVYEKVISGGTQRKVFTAHQATEATHHPHEPRPAEACHPESSDAAPSTAWPPTRTTDHPP